MNRKKREKLIFDAAIRVFARQGYPKTSVSEIIQEANVARGTFYLYFKSKKELFNALLDNYLQNILQDVSKINSFPINRDGEMQPQYRALASDLITTITRNRYLTKMILTDAQEWESEFGEKLNLFFDQLAKHIQNNLGKSTILGAHPDCSTEVMARCMIGSVKEMILTWLRHNHLELEASIKGLISFLMGSSLAISTAKIDQSSQSEQKPITRQNINNLH